MSQSQKQNTLFKSKSYTNYKKLRPFLIKLVAHLVLLVISVRAYMLYLSSNGNYTDFLGIMNRAVITDVILVDKNKECESPYEEIKSFEFPSTLPGCRCDYKIFRDDICEAFGSSNTFLGNFKKCFFQDLVMRGDTPRQPTRMLQQNLDEVIDNILPDSCDCMQAINSVNKTKEISYWIPNKKICILKDYGTSTHKYLSSALEPCDPENVCQNYFCKTDNLKENKCPIVDIYFDHSYTPTIYNNSRTAALMYNDTVWNLHATTVFNQSFIGEKTFNNTILFPLLDIHIAGNGKCVDGTNSLISSYTLIPETKCPFSQRYYSIHKQSMKDVLNNNDKYYDYLATRLPLLTALNVDDTKWSLDLEYPAFRNSLTCLMNYYDQQNPNKTDISGKIGFVLQSFITLNKSDFFQNFVQICLLVLNILVVLINFIVVSYKSYKIFKNPTTAIIKNIMKCEKFFGFLLDVAIAILGGFAFFSLNVYKNYLSQITNTNCLDDFMLYKFNTYSDSLEATAEQNLQIFIIVIVKLLIIIVIVSHYSCSKKCKIKFNNILKLLRDHIEDKTISSAVTSFQETHFSQNTHRPESKVILQVQTGAFHNNCNDFQTARKSWHVNINPIEELDDDDGSLDKVPSRSYDLSKKPVKLYSMSDLILTDVLK
jgi:hypothetical protein